MQRRLIGSWVVPGARAVAASSLWLASALPALALSAEVVVPGGCQLLLRRTTPKGTFVHWFVTASGWA
jgi:hypothetical protein